MNMSQHTRQGIPVPKIMLPTYQIEAMGKLFTISENPSDNFYVNRETGIIHGLTEDGQVFNIARGVGKANPRRISRVEKPSVFNKLQKHNGTLYEILKHKDDHSYYGITEHVCVIYTPRGKRRYSVSACYIKDVNLPYSRDNKANGSPRYGKYQNTGVRLESKYKTLDVARHAARLYYLT
jgi:hypothetical protein